MGAISEFFTHNIVYVYFLYGLAFFALGLVVLLESGRASEFRFARALLPLALFGFVHSGHEWFEMFQVFAAHESGAPSGFTEEIIRLVSLVASFVFLLLFGTRLLPDAERNPRLSYWQVTSFVVIWLVAVMWVYLRQKPTLDELVVAADVLARYILGITGALMASWALLRERRDFHARGMSPYGQALLWAALAFFVYGVFGQLFVRPSIVAPSQLVNTAFFLRLFGIPVQLLRGVTATAIAITLGSALRAFEAESRLRLARANKARLEAQAIALDAQQHRTQEVEALNVQLQGRTRELSALVEMSRILSSTIELDRVLHYALYQIVHSFGMVYCSAIFLKRPDTAVELAREYRRPNAPAPVVSLPLQAVATRTIISGQAVGASMDGRLQPLDDMNSDGMPGWRDSSSIYRILGVPLLAQGEPFGSLIMASLREDTPFSAQDLNLLAAFARQVTTSIENARLYQVVQEREGRLAELVRQLVNAQEGERQRIARELHDETGQKLTALTMGLAAVDANLGSDDWSGAQRLVHDLRKLGDDAMIELRNIMSDLRPALLDDLGLAPALRSYVQQYVARHPELHMTLNVDRQVQRLAPQFETVLFRVAQEALTNIVRHAQATHVTVTLAYQPNRVQLIVRDDGTGFDLNTPSQHALGSGLGLVGMRERVALVGGEFSIESATGQGTQIVVELPLK